VMMSLFLTLKNVKRKKMRKRLDRQRLKSCQAIFAEAVDKKLKSAKSGSAEQKGQTLKNAVLTQAK